MFDYTRAVFDKSVRDFKKLGNIANVLMQVMYISYMIYNLIIDAGWYWVNAILLGLSLGYLIIYLLFYGKKDHDHKQVLRASKRVYKWTKILVNTFTLGVTLYNAYVAATTMSAFSIIITTLTIIMWVLSVIVEVIAFFVQSRYQLVLDAIEADKQEAIEPVKKVGDFFKKLAGKEVEEREPTHKRKKLDKILSEYQERREKRKQEKDQEKERKHKN